MANSPPTLTGLTPVTFLENTVNAVPQLLAPDVTFTDPDNNFNGGTLTVTGLLAEDTVAIRNQGAGPGEIGVVGAAVFFGGFPIGVFTGGVGSTLIVAFLPGATAPVIEALIENLTYANSSDTPTASRGLELKVTDAAGATSIAPTTFAEPIALDPVGSDTSFFNEYGSNAPSLADLDGDGDLDAVIGDRYGELYYFENVGSATAAVFREATGNFNPFKGVDVGFYSAPTFADLDGDGDLDLVVGNGPHQIFETPPGPGSLRYFENTGSAFTERTGAANPLEGISIPRIKPSFADLDGDGDSDLVVGSADGNLYYFRNTGSPVAPAFTEITGAANPFNNFNNIPRYDLERFYSTPTFADLDGDGDFDAVVGMLNGTLRYFKNIGSATAPAFADQGTASPLYLKFGGFNASPTFADLDGDGTFDLAVGNIYGGLSYFKNTTENFTLVVHVNAQNDPAVLSADVRNLTETNAAADLSSSGTLTITDPDSAGMFVEQAGTVGLYGTFATNMDGAWTYTASSAHNEFVAGTTYTDTFDVTSWDFGTSFTLTSVTINILGSDDAAVLSPDAVTTTENTALDGSVFADNGSGPDSDPDTALVVGQVNRNAGDVNSPVVLLSGALLTVKADGDFIYDPHGAFDYLPAPGSGASNLSAVDTFTYTVGTVTATVTVTVTGVDSDDTLIGTAGIDNLRGGIGNDTYVVNSIFDAVIENADEGIDMVDASTHYRLGANLENLMLLGSADLQGYGNALANTLTGNTGSNLLDGGGGADAMYGGAGNDVYIVDDAGDTVIENANGGIDAVFATVDYTLSANVEALVLQGGADLQGFGNGLINALYGNAGNNQLDGGAGADAMSGGAGNDSYVVDNAGDAVFENVNEGTDTVFASAHFRLSANVENLTLTGSADLQGYGNSDANTLTGNSGANLLDGGIGADTMAGAAGNDVYFVDNIGDSVIENPGEGTDAVFATIDYTLTANVEALVLQGSADLQGFGNGLANALYGNAGNNQLDGGAGADAMFGGVGDDTFFVDDASDAVFENSGEGNDTVFASAHFRLSANVENLTLTGSADLQGYGNADANTLTGNSGANLLDGGAGADTMSGGAGNDVYFVDDLGDTVIEDANEGTDAVFATVDFTLTANVETLVLQGAGNLGGTGNALANKLFGNTGDNALDGGGGADRLTGGTGNDTFVFNVGEADGDTILDFAGNGAGAGDALQFVGYGVGATFTQNDATHWQVNYAGGASHEVITFTNGAAIDASDVLFS